MYALHPSSRGMDLAANLECEVGGEVQVVRLPQEVASSCLWCGSQCHSLPEVLASALSSASSGQKGSRPVDF